MDKRLFIDFYDEQEYNDYLSKCTKEDINKHGKDGFSILHHIHRNLNRLRAILDKGPDVNIKDITKTGNTPLHWAVVSHNKVEHIKLLLEYGASPYIKNNYDRNVFEEVDHVIGEIFSCSCGGEFKCVHCWSIRRLQKDVIMISNHWNQHQTLFSMMFSDIDEYNSNKKRRFH